MDPKTLRYAKTHEWAHLDGDLCTVGLTQFAVEQLTDVIYVDLPDLGDPAMLGESFGEIESVKAVSDLFAPVDGEVVETNAALTGQPELVNSEPYHGGWLVRLRLADASQLDELLDPAAYDALIAAG